MLDRLITAGWVLDRYSKAWPIAVGYLNSNSVTNWSYDFTVDTTDVNTLINELPQDFRFICIQMCAPWVEGSLPVSLVVDNAGLIIGFDVDHESLLDEERPDSEKANLRQFISLAEPLLAELGPSPGTIEVEADINLEGLNLDWRFWPPDVVKRADPLALEVIRRTAYLCYDFDRLGLFVAMTPLLHFDYDQDYERRMRILGRAFGKTEQKNSKK